MRTNTVKIEYHMCLLIVQSIEYELTVIVQMCRLRYVKWPLASIFVAPALGGKQSHTTAYHFEMCNEVNNFAKCKVQLGRLSVCASPSPVLTKRLSYTIRIFILQLYAENRTPSSFTGSKRRFLNGCMVNEKMAHFVCR